MNERDNRHEVHLSDAPRDRAASSRRSPEVRHGLRQGDDRCRKYGSANRTQDGLPDKCRVAAARPLRLDGLRARRGNRCHPVLRRLRLPPVVVPEDSPVLGARIVRRCWKRRLQRTAVSTDSGLAGRRCVGPARPTMLPEDNRPPGLRRGRHGRFHRHVNRIATDSPRCLGRHPSPGLPFEPRFNRPTRTWPGRSSGAP